MGFEILTLASLAFKAFSTIQANKAQDQIAQQAVAQSDAEVIELQRQRDERSEIAQEEKADRVREADQQFASMVTRLADVGGAGTQNEARFAQEIGGFEGLDVARIESNRRRDVESIKSRQQVSQSRALDTVAATKGRKKANSLGFISSAVGAGVSISGHRQREEQTKQRGT